MKTELIIGIFYIQKVVDKLWRVCYYIFTTKKNTARSPLKHRQKGQYSIMIVEVRAFVFALLIFYKEVFFISKEAPQLNGEIRDKEVRVITADGEQLGIMSAKEAQNEADKRGQDLVKIAPQAKPPVVKIMDYSKFRYEQAKREKENRKKQKTVETKEIRLSLNIDIGDFNTKVNQAKKFLAKGDKLKVSIRLRGREMAHPEIGTANIERFAAALGEDINVDKAPKLEGRQILMFVSSKLSK